MMSASLPCNAFDTVRGASSKDVCIRLLSYVVARLSKVGEGSQVYTCKATLLACRGWSWAVSRAVSVVFCFSVCRQYDLPAHICISLAPAHPN